MESEQARAYRKNLSLHGLIYLGGEERGITVKNLSITGVLAELHNAEPDNNAIKTIFNNLSLSTTIDFYLPDMRLAGEVEVIRVDLQKEKILLALEFKSISYDVDNFLYKRKAYRKRLPGPGLILLHGKYHEFNAVNVSVDGLMARFDDKIEAEEDTITTFEFNRLQLRGEIKVVWHDYLADGGTLMGLQYMHMEQTAVKGIPRFAKS